MNIFYLDTDPQTCAEMHISKHVVKMIIEYAQLMSTAHRVIDGEEYIDASSGRKIKRWRLDGPLENVLYKATHINHPSAIWCRANRKNYVWLYCMWFYLLKEYTYRYGKQHACEKLRDGLYLPPEKISNGDFFAPTPAMPDDVKIAGNSLASYHNYYNLNKRSFASWQGKVNSRSIPQWFNT